MEFRLHSFFAKIGKRNENKCGMKKEYHIIQSRYMRHVHTHRATRTYVKSCSPKNNRSNKKKTLFFFKKMASFFKNLLIFLLPSEICHIP